MQEAIKHILIGVIMLLNIINQAIAQNSERVITNQLGIAHDNDFLVITDRYYTYGLSVNYNRILNKGVFNNSREQLRFSLSQKAYTPTDIETENILEMDRPYAGFLSLDSDWQITMPKTIYNFNLLIGIVGPSSGVGQFQRWYHDNIVKYKTPTWTNELDNRFHTNLSVSITKEWELAPNPFGVRIAAKPSVVVGSKDIYVKPETILFFGRRSSLQNTMAHHQIGDLEREIYFSLNFAYRWVTKNALLEFNDLKNEVFLFNFNFHHRYLTHEYRVGYHFNTKEAQELDSHQFISLSYAKSF